MINPCLQVIPKRQRRQPVQIEQHSLTAELPDPEHQADLADEQAQKGVVTTTPLSMSNVRREVR